MLYWAQTCNYFSIYLHFKSLVYCDSHNSLIVKWLPHSLALLRLITKKELLTLVTTIFCALFCLGSWPPYPAVNANRKKIIIAQGLSFCSPALKQMLNACKCAAVVPPSSENNYFSMQTLMSNQWTFKF